MVLQIDSTIPVLVKEVGPNTAAAPFRIISQATRSIEVNFEGHIRVIGVMGLIALLSPALEIDEGLLG